MQSATALFLATRIPPLPHPLLVLALNPRIGPFHALPLTNDHFSLPCTPRLQRRQPPSSPPAPIPGDPNLFPAHRERHLGTPGRAPRLWEARAASSPRGCGPHPGGAGEASLEGLLSLTRGSSGQSGRVGGSAGWRAAEFADSKARRWRWRAPRSAHERSPALPAHVAAPRPRDLWLQPP